MPPLLCQKVPANDGINLATDVYFPNGSGPFPVVLVRTPYNRVGQQGIARQFVRRGYAFVAQDCRGKYDSEGQFTPLVDEARDGQATLDWIANQRWCNGRIGMWGRSYLGIVQVPAACGGHEALKCIAPSVAPGSYFRDWIRYDGCFALGNAIRWSLTHASSKNQPPMDHFEWDDLHGLSDPEAIAEQVGFQTPVISTWALHDSYDAYWEAIDQCTMHDQVGVPGLHAGGWFDHLTRSQFEAYVNIRDKGATEVARKGQRLLIGPWGHSTISGSGKNHCRYGEWNFGPNADFSVLDHELQFLDYYLQEKDNGFTGQEPVKVFLMGENRWVYASDWPPPEAQDRAFYLGSQGSANMKIGDGTLAGDSSSADGEDGYVYDPRDPVPTLGGAVYWGLDSKGPMDQQAILGRGDVLYYRSERLTEPMVVIGNVGLDLCVSTDAVDTDFIVKLCVEDASGTVTCLTLGSLRCRYRDGWTNPVAMPAGEVVSIRVDLGNVAYTFAEDSRVGLIVTSSDFPRIQPHPNTLTSPWAGTGMQVANNRVHHGRGAPSCLHLPIMPK